jgi:hypothetical protein
MNKQVTCTNGAVIEWVASGTRYNRRNSRWILISGEWPSKEELLKIGDGWIPPAPHGVYDFAPFGGTVDFVQNGANISVYTD